MGELFKKELAGWMEPESGGQRLSAQVETGKMWCPLRALSSDSALKYLYQ